MVSPASDASVPTTETLLGAATLSVRQLLKIPSISLWCASVRMEDSVLTLDHLSLRKLHVCVQIHMLVPTVNTARSSLELASLDPLPLSSSLSSSSSWSSSPRWLSMSTISASVENPSSWEASPTVSASDKAPMLSLKDHHLLRGRSPGCSGQQRF